MEEKSKFGDMAMGPEKASHADADPGDTDTGLVRLEMVGCVYWVVVEVLVEALEMDWLGGENWFEGVE